MKRPSATCSRTGWDFTATPMPTSSRKGEDPSFLRTQLSTLNAVCAPGTCWDYQNVAYDASSEMVSRITHMPYEQAVRRYLFNPIGMSSGSVSMAGLEANKSWARPHSAGTRPWPMVDTYYKVPGAAGINSNIKDMALWMEAQMGEMPDVLDGKVLDTIHAPYVVTPTERGRMRKFLERLGTAWYGYGWRSYDYAGHRIVGHRGGIRGYRSLILFDPQKKSGVVALWNSDTWQPGGLEFEVMDHDLSPAVPRLAGAQQDAGAVDRSGGLSEPDSGGPS